jgi:Flp pilus assembly protein TadG
MASRTVFSGWMIEFLRRVFPQPARRRLFSRRQTAARGQASLEMLVVLFMLVPLLFGAIEISRGVAIRAALDSGVGMAVRALSLDTSFTQWTWATIQTNAAVNQNVFGGSGIGTPSYQLLDSLGNPIDQATLDTMGLGETFCLEGTVPYAPSVPLISLSSINITVRHCGVVDRP